MTQTYIPFHKDNPWRLDSFMNVEEWKMVTGWYPYSLRSMLPDGRWYEHARCKSQDAAYTIMRALYKSQPLHYFIIVQCLLTGNDGREKVVVFLPGSETSVLAERQSRLKNAVV